LGIIDTGEFDKFKATQELHQLSHLKWMQHIALKRCGDTSASLESFDTLLPNYYHLYLKLMIETL
jgi:hypothetical protein